MCGSAAGYNRAVVDLSNNREEGGFCKTCERAEFGKRLELLTVGTPDTCTFCEQESSYALPEWLVVTSDSYASSTTYRITDDTIRLCVEHYRFLQNLSLQYRASTNLDRNSK